MGFVLANQLPKGCIEKYDALIYNRVSFLNSNNDLPQIHFYWIEKTSNIAFAHIAFSLEESQAYSPLKAPFGGVEYSNELSFEDLFTFLIFVEKALKAKGVKYLILEQAPEIYGDQTKLLEVLKDLKYQPKGNRIYHGIKVTDGDLRSKLSLMEQRRLKKCEKANFRFEEMPLNNLSEVYNAIDGWRNKVEKPLSMDWKVLNHARRSNPEMYIPFGIYDDKQLIAATIAIQVNSKALYHFYPAHNPEYNNFSPMVMLVDGLYKWCLANRIDLLDLGTSYIGNKMNQSLIRFKKHLGGEESKAIIFRKVLSSQ